MSRAFLSPVPTRHPLLDLVMREKEIPNWIYGCQKKSSQYFDKSNQFWLDVLPSLGLEETVLAQDWVRCKIQYFSSLHN